MSLINWFASVLGNWRPLVQPAFHAFMGGVSCVLAMGSLAGAHEWERENAGGKVFVVSGFGYQNDAESIMRIKVYDGGSGEVLAEDVFELHVQEDVRPDSSPPQARIFAGGIGKGVSDLSDLSEFVLRVYDAKTGEFQWAGQLNFTGERASEAGHLVSTEVRRRAVVAPVRLDRDIEMARPLFVLRAWNRSTGGLVWEDRFSPDGAGLFLARPMATRSPVGNEKALGADVFDFRVLMFDRAGNTVLWEDQARQPLGYGGAPKGTMGDRAQRLPAWTGPTARKPAPAEGL